MIAKFSEATQDDDNGFNWGKFVIMRFQPAEIHYKSALPAASEYPLLAGRKWTHQETFIADLQTGEGAAFSLDSGGFTNGSDAAHYDLNKHHVWVCPMFEPFLAWLIDQGTWARGAGDINDIPALVEIPNAPAAMAGYRRGDVNLYGDNPTAPEDS